MENLTVDSVYGVGLYEAAKDLDLVEDFQATFKDMRELFKNSPEFLDFLKAPTIDVSERKKIVSIVFEGKISQEILNFIFLLIDKRRIGQFIGITNRFDKICDEKSGIIKGEIYSTIPLSEDQISKFEKETGKLLKKRVELKNQIDKSILGGIKIQIDGKNIDASVRGRLDELKEKIL